MVRITDYKKIQSEDGKDFNLLTVTGGLEMVKSKTTGRFYATMRKASIPSTFDEATCQNLIGQEMPGTVEKVPCEEYEVLDKNSGEIITLEYRYEYIDTQTKEEAILEPQVLI